MRSAIINFGENGRWYENRESKNGMKKRIFLKNYIVVLLSFLCTGIAFGQESIEKIGEEGLLYVPGEHILSMESAALTSDGNTIAIGVDREIRLYSLSELKALKFFTVRGDLSGEVTFSPDNKLIASSDIEGRFSIWAATTTNSKLIKLMRGFSEEGGGMEYIHSITFSNDGNYFAAGSAGTEVFLWDTNSWKQIRLFNHYGNAMKVRFSPDDKYLGVATAEFKSGHMAGKIVIRDWRARRTISEMSTKGVLATAIAFSPDGQLIAGGNTDGDIGVWRITDGSLVSNLKGHEGRIYDLSFSSDGQFLASAGEDRDAIIWDMKRLKLLKRIPHNYRVVNVIFWQNNNVLVTSDKKGINFWRVSDGKQLGRFIALEGAKFVVYTSEGYYETDAPEYLQPTSQENQQDSLKKMLHQPERVTKILHMVGR